jgi:hypothetical protein
MQFPCAQPVPSGCVVGRGGVGWGGGGWGWGPGAGGEGGGGGGRASGGIFAKQRIWRVQLAAPEQRIFPSHCGHRARFGAGHSVGEFFFFSFCCTPPEVLTIKHDPSDHERIDFCLPDR